MKKMNVEEMREVVGGGYTCCGKKYNLFTYIIHSFWHWKVKGELN